MSVGYMYILSNPAIPGLLKIGFTNRDIKDRVAELSSATAVPKRFEVEYYCLTRDVEEIERKVHQHLSAHRARGKEFFSVQIGEAVKIIDSLVKPVVPERFCKDMGLGIRLGGRREEKKFDPDALKRWQEKRWNSNKPE